MLPNITEASLLTDTEYREEYGEEYICGLVDGIHRLGAGTVVLTGVSYDAHSTGVLVSSRETDLPPPRTVDRGCHGTGDVYASSFCGAYMHGKNCPGGRPLNRCGLYPGLHQKHPDDLGPLVRCEVRAGAGGTD